MAEKVTVIYYQKKEDIGTDLDNILKYAKKVNSGSDEEFIGVEVEELEIK